MTFSREDSMFTSVWGPKTDGFSVCCLTLGLWWRVLERLGHLSQQLLKQPERSAQSPQRHLLREQACRKQFPKAETCCFVVCDLKLWVRNCSLCKTTQVWTKERRTRCWQCRKTYILTPPLLVWNKQLDIYIECASYANVGSRANSKQHVQLT